MEQVYVEQSLYNRMRGVAAAQGITTPDRLLDLVLRTQNHVIPESRPAMLDILDTLDVVQTTAVFVSDHAANIVKQLARKLKVNHIAIASYILQDTLPVLEVMPDEIEGFVALRQESVNRQDQRATMHVNIYTETKNAVQTHLDTHQDLPFSTPSDYIRTLLVNLPSLEILRRVALRTTADGMPIATMMTGKGYSTIRVPIEVFYKATNLSHLTGIPRTRLLSFLILEILRQTQAINLLEFADQLPTKEAFKKLVEKYLVMSLEEAE